MMTKGLVIAGLAGGSGKSVVTVGLIAALVGQGKTVVPFKKGPDYIDAGWLKLAAGRSCYNLDPYLMTEAAILSSFHRRSREGDLAVVEGNRGLYDGVNPEGAYSTAELALSAAAADTAGRELHQDDPYGFGHGPGLSEVG